MKNRRKQFEYGKQWRVVKRLVVMFGLQLAVFYFGSLFALAADEGRINISAGGHTYRIPYFRNYPLSTRNDNIRRAVIAIQGAGGADIEYERLRNAACLPGSPPCPRLDYTLIMSVHFMGEDDLAGYGLSTDGLFWAGGWRFGDLSLSTSSHPRADRVSSYTVMDNIVEFLATSGNFPNLQKIIIAGQSAMGQYVNRYAAISPIEVTIAGSGVDMKYIVMNPSTYLYFTNERVYPGTMDTFLEPHPFWSSLCPATNCCHDDESCPSITYDDYFFGLSNPSSYNTYLSHVVDAIGVEGIKNRYRNKTVAYLLGRLDKDPCAEGLDNSCGARLEGRTRLERGLIYYNYIGHALGTSVYGTHHLETIENACHNSDPIYRSNLGRKHVFDIAAVAEAPEIIAPMGTVEWVDHTYQWYATPGASEYRISVTDTSGGAGSFTQSLTPEDAGCPHGGLCSKRITRAVSEGTFTVSARILTTWLDSASASFRVEAPPGVTVHAPTGSIVDHTPTFKWDAAEGATRYQLAVFNPSGINHVGFYSSGDANCDCGTSAPTCTGGEPPSCVVTAGPMLNDGQYWWMVRPGNAAGMGPWTPVQAFTVGTPALLSDGEYTLKVRSSGKCLEHDTSRGNNVQLRGCRGESDQKWALSGSMSVANLETVNLRSNMCLEADDSGGSDMTNGGNVQIADCIGGSSSPDDHQEWSISVAGDGYYRLTVRSSGKCLDADNYDNNDMKECGNVQVWDCKDPATRNTDNQEWRIEPANADEFRHPGRPSTYPVPNIQVNGQDRTVNVRRGESITVSFSLTNWNTIGPECDWWFFQTSPAGIFYWTPHGWTTAPQPAVQGSIFDFPPPIVELPILTADIAAGTYWLYFAIDGNPDGFLSLNSLYLDGIRVNVMP